MHKVMEDETSELLRLTRENNEMLKEITAYIRKVDSVDYRNSEYEREFAFNVIADIFVEVMEDSRRTGLRDSLKGIFNQNH